MSKKADLTPKQAAFLAEYLRNGRVAGAAYRAAYNAKGMSDAAVAVEASRLLSNPKIALKLAEARETTGHRLQVTSDDITLSAYRGMMASLRRTLGPDGNPLPMKDWPEDLWLAIDGYEWTRETLDGITTEKIKVKLTSRATARDQLAKHVGYYAEDNKQKGAGLLAALNDLPDDVRGRMIEKLRGIAGRTGPVAGAGTPPAAGTERLTH